MNKRIYTKPTIQSELDWFRKKVAESIQTLRYTHLTYEQTKHINKISKLVVELIDEVKKLNQ